MARLARIVFPVWLALTLPAPLGAQVSGTSTGDCNYNDGRGWVRCGDYPAGAASDAPGPSSAGPSPLEQQMQQQMYDAAGQLGAAIGAAIGRALSGEADREKAQSFNNQAIAAANRGDWKRAKALTRQALQLAPEDPTLKVNLSLIQRQITETERLEAARAQEENLRRQEAERQAAARRREEIAQRVSGTLILSGDAATSDAGNPLGLMIGDGTESGADLHPQGTPFFGLGGGPTRMHAEPASDARVVDLRDGGSTIAASGNAQAQGGAGIRQGVPDRSPAANPLGLMLGDTSAVPAVDASVVDLRDAHPGNGRENLAQLLSRSDRDPMKQKDPGRFISEVTPGYLEMLGWSREERVRVAALMKNIYRYPTRLSSQQVRDLYGAPFAMDAGRYANLAAAARGGMGRNLISEGFQSGNDCAVFALANAANLPYSVAATRTLELLRTAPWRSPQERANPASILSQEKNKGLIGGEVDILAQAFGDAHVVDRSALPNELAKGNAVIATIAMDTHQAHTVVVTRVFQYENQAYYEVMDSNARPARCRACQSSRVYWRKVDFDAVLEEDGIVVTPKAKTVVKSLK